MEQVFEWREYVQNHLHQLEEIMDVSQIDEGMIDLLSDTLAQIFENQDERQVEAYLHAQWAILARIFHFSDFLNQNMPDENLFEIQQQQFFLVAVYRLAENFYSERYEKALVVPQIVERSTGFLRTLRDHCGLQYVMHYVGYSLRTFLNEVEGIRESDRQDQEFFEESMKYLVEMVIDFEDHEDIEETLTKQRDELTWLQEEITLKQEEIGLEPDNERFRAELEILELDFMTEKLEYEYLLQIIEPIF
jgi:hypothetical protein